MDNGKKYLLLIVFSLFLMTGCASQIQDIQIVESAASAPVTTPSKTGLKHRIAIAKFEDKTGYGSNLFGAIDDLGTQAADILASHLIKTGEFIVIERSNLKDIQSENQLQSKTANIIGVSSLIFGAVTEFGTKTETVDEGLSKTKLQTAHAKVTIRLVDPKTAVAFYSEFGEANAVKSTSQTLGFGATAGYDATLTDKALNGAIVKLVSNVTSTLRGLPWQTSILDIQGNQVFIGAGKRTNLTVGTILDVIRPGASVTNPTTGALIQLPGQVIGKIKVASQFGTSDVDEGSVCEIVDGNSFTKTDIIQYQETK